ncbi:MAG TPA: response regulator [Candidatus Krumholzibacteria bacterium]|nr:response regulator [Candidatus Krumholzibacteria bacterium]HPD72908.1 response regulator [Candidatus Krumholzibacteria bacterium]HRY41707.1 response regulator [Candidatus Krumholzibacteria bacterium]
MAALWRESLVWRLLALVGGAFAVVSLIVFLLVDSLIQRVVYTSNVEVYSERIDAMVHRLAQQASRLALTGQPEFYRPEYQDVVLRELAQTYYRAQATEIYPFIVDSTGMLIMHPQRERADAALFESLQARRRTPDARGEFKYTKADGQQLLVTFRSFPTWGWAAGYRVPVATLMADAAAIRRQLFLVWFAATACVLVALAFVLRRETRPLRELTEAAAAMAEGDLIRAVEADHPGEVGVLAKVFVHMRDAIRRQLSELRESESRYRKIFDAGTDGLLLLDHDGVIVAANPRAAAAYGWSIHQLTGRHIESLLREHDRELAHALRNPPADKPLTISSLTCDREGRELETEISAVRLSFQNEPHALVILRDVTAQRRLERQLLQSQKLESVGRLAGGIAHDFNNLLTPVLGYSEMLMQDPDLSPEARADLAAIQRAGERARNLARQLLAFSRRQVLELVDINLGQTLADFEPIMRRTLREDIELVLHRHDANCRVRADLSQIEQIIMNLAINALDAMPDGGRLEMTTARRMLDHATAAHHPDVEPGVYASLVVRDTGPGIPPQIIDRVFEPFFTTKEAGKGTGLGLATIHGIVTQHGGWVGVRNHPAGGCEVEILLPCLPDPAPSEALNEPATRSLMRGHGETVILVEDDEMVRELVQALLTKHGYAVRTFTSGRECLDALMAQPQPADLLLTDVVMPGLNGPELRDRLKSAGILLPVLFMSGYAGETLVRRGLADARADFLQKPLTPEQLLFKLRQMLEVSRQSPHG